MTQQEILEYNKRCAEFLGFKCSINKQYELPKMMTFPPKKNSNLCYTAKICCIDDMQFHIDWNWIHEMIEAIEKLGFYTKILDNGMSIEKKGTLILERWGKTKKEGTILAINSFLKFYNKNLEMSK